MSIKEPLKKLRVETMRITPAMAKKWLENNTHNRPAKPSTARSMAADMRADRWEPNGETIKLGYMLDAENNRIDIIVDGANRLMSCVEADTAFDSLVVFDLPVRAQLSVDSGSKRNLGDQLKLIYGHKNSILLSGVIRLSWRWENNVLTFGNIYPSIAQALEWYEANRGIDAFVSVATYVRNHSVYCPGSVLTAFCYAAARTDAAAVKDFTEKLATNVGLKSVRDPIYVYGRWLENAHLSTNQRVSEVMHLALIIKAWNYYLQGRQISSMRWRRGGDKAEPFPALLSQQDIL